MEKSMGEISPLGRRIKLLRTRRGLSMYKLAQLAKVSRPSISFIESGRHASMNADALSRIARVLGVTTDSLLYGDVLEEKDSDLVAAIA
jgi:transcriptional regulator with XRE-family HTH domain